MCDWYVLFLAQWTFISKYSSSTYEYTDNVIVDTKASLLVSTYLSRHERGAAAGCVFLGSLVALGSGIVHDHEAAPFNA